MISARKDCRSLFISISTMTTLGSCPRRRARVNGCIAAVLSLFVVHSAIFLLTSVLAKDLRYSRFFNANDYIAKRSTVDQQRMESAMNFFSEIQANNTRSRKNYFYETNRHATIRPNGKAMTIPLEYCIGIPSSIQRRDHYVLQLAHHLLTQLSAEEQRMSTVILLGDSSNNSDVNSVAQVFPSMEIQRNNSRTRSGSAASWALDESMDYATLLDACSKKAKFTIILEDDVVGSKNWINKLTKSLNEYKPPLQDLGFIKLFYTEHWQGWGNDDIPLLTIVGVLVALIAGFTLPYCFRLNGSTRWFVAVLIGCDITLLVYSIGKQHLFPFKSGLYEFNSPCCTPAHVYNSDLVPLISSCIRTKAPTGTPIDLILDACVTEMQLKRYLLVPNLFQHIGLYSTNTEKNQGNYLGMKTSLTFDDS